MTPASGDGYYPANALVSLTAKPNPGFTFKGFDLVPIGNPVTVAMNGPVKITAFFEQQALPPPSPPPVLQSIRHSRAMREPA